MDRAPRGVAVGPHPALHPGAGQRLPLAHLIPERPVYRPDDTVHLLAWVRDRVQGRLRVPEARGYRVRITAPDGKTTLLSALADAHGVVAVDFGGIGRPTGGYEADLVGNGDGRPWRRPASASRPTASPASTWT